MFKYQCSPNPVFSVKMDFSLSQKYMFWILELLEIPHSSLNIIFLWFLGPPGKRFKNFSQNSFLQSISSSDNWTYQHGVTSPFRYDPSWYSQERFPVDFLGDFCSDSWSTTHISFGVSGYLFPNNFLLLSWKNIISWLIARTFQIFLWKNFEYLL